MDVSRRLLVRVLPLAAAVITLGQTAADPDVATVVNAAAAYVKEYQTQLGSVIADETYLQQIIRQLPGDPAMPRMRRLTGEMFFMFAPTGEWLAIRDVIRADGQEIKDRRVVADALRTLPAEQVAEAFKAYNSRFNLGRTIRNFNEPTLSLLVLDDRHRARFTFDRRRVDRRRDGTLVTIAFTEREGETSLIRDLTSGAVVARGEFVAEADTGRIRRAVLRAKAGPVSLELVTEYALDNDLALWVPSRFRERYESGVAPTSFEVEAEYEDVVCDATYSNYRRFQTSGRINKLAPTLFRPAV